MTPLGASLIFVVISILVSLFRHIFITDSLGSNDDSNISITRIHTLAAGSNNDNQRPYNSFYQALYKPHVGRVQTPHLPYNSYALKKAVINSQGVYLCEQKFAAIFEESTSCKAAGECHWSTSIMVYRLPFFKSQESKSIQVQGRVRGNGENRALECHDDGGWNFKFKINFVLLLGNKQSKKGQRWAMHSLVIQQEQSEWRDQQNFSIKMLKWNLKNITHYPQLYSFDQKCLSYVTAQQPWLINYNCNDKWTTFNILQSRIQNYLFNNQNGSQPFSSTHHVKPVFMELFTSTQITYAPNQCQSGEVCPPKKQCKQVKNFITFVFEIVNSPRKYGRLVAQFTLLLADQTTTSQALVSYNLLMTQVNPQLPLKTDCRITTSEHRLIRGLYTYQLSYGNDEHLAAVANRHSLLCIFGINPKQQLRVVEVEDVISTFNYTDMPRDITIWRRETLQQKRMEGMRMRRIKNKQKKQKEEEQEESWFDFDLFDFKYNSDDLSQGQQADKISADQPVGLQKKDKDKKKTQKKESKINKRNKKGKSRAGRQNFKFEDNPIGWKLQQMADQFADIGYNQPEQMPAKTIYIPLPHPGTPPESIHFSVINSDLQFPLIYLKTNRRYFLTYQPIEQQQSSGSKNGSEKTGYIYKYQAIGAQQKPLHTLLWRNNNITNQTIKYNENQHKIDRFLLDIGQHLNIMNHIQSFSVVQARHQGRLPHQHHLHGMIKPYRKQVVVIWGWGIEVYEINWDKRGHKAQLMEIQEQLNMNQEGIEMVFLLPFIELFATVYCLFQALITSR